MRKTKDLLQKNKGITLIALVITITVMLILVAVTISMAINGGLFGYAGKAAGDTQNAIEAEQELGSGKIKIDGKWYNNIDDYIAGKPIEDGNGDGEGGNPEGGLQIELSIAGEKVTEVPIPTGFIYKEGTTDTGYVIINETDGNEFVWVPVDKNQKITLKVASDKDIRKLNLIDPYGDKILTIEDGNIQNTYNNTNIEPTINGMYIAQVTTEEGLIEETITVRSLYAVDSWNDWYTSEEYIKSEVAGTEYEGISKVEYYELLCELMGYGDLKSFLDSSGLDSLDQMITNDCGQRFKEYEDLVDYTESINKNGGFYVARYELGTSKTAEGRSSGTVNYTIDKMIEEFGMPVSKEGYYPYNVITFEQALGLTESMYTGDDFTVSLLTNSAWDRMLGWICATGSKSIKEILEDSGSWGNYSDVSFEITKGKYSEYDGHSYTTFSGTYLKETGTSRLLTTGASVRNSANNIFDIAGNNAEWVNAADSSTKRATRGR